MSLSNSLNLVRQLGKLLLKIWLNSLIYMVSKKIFYLVKDEWFNFNSLIVVLKLVVNCQALGLQESYHELALDMHIGVYLYP